MTPDHHLTASEKAARAWGPEMPDWVRALAEACDKSSQAKVAKVIGNSSSVVNRVLSNSYPGNMNKVAEKVRGHYLSERVTCPALGDISRQRCVAEQDRKLSAQNPLRVRIYRACRSGCPNSRLGAGK